MEYLAGSMPHSWQLFLISFGVLSCASYFGALVIARLRRPEAGGAEDVRMILGATLTLLGLIIGFTLSMAIGGYNTRQSNEAAEAAAISTAFNRADLLPAAETSELRSVLTRYLDARLQFYRAHDRVQLQNVDAQTKRLSHEMWSVAVRGAAAQPTPPTTLAVASVNDVLTSYSNTQAGWRNQIPVAAWALMVAIAICCNVLIGYSAGNRRHRASLMVLPFVISVSFTLIGDVDVPGRGAIRVAPVNIERVAGLLGSASVPSAPTSIAP
ncbi:bestrophin-like domain [Paraburkholderia antibiotica]|uniref:DUF4239 domain-containing protein n=1 Tax=Paraburkholderia antibiotica TaxID=2728839 RepID=A0A7Y0FGF3_9BURK|nr:hypothetical protein [Paraburkholderia antibiotica]NML35131.1 hypothetical protein [Paraburkholderia antibiotica]